MCESSQANVSVAPTARGEYAYDVFIRYISGRFRFQSPCSQRVLGTQECPFTPVLLLAFRANITTFRCSERA